MLISGWSWMWILRNNWPKTQRNLCNVTNNCHLESPVCQLFLENYGSTSAGNKVQSMALGWYLKGEGSQEQHLTILVEHFGRLQEHGIMVNPAKYIFFQSGFEFPEHWSFKHCIRRLPQQVDAIIESESYKCHRLEVVSGTNLAITLQTLHDLLQKKRPWSGWRSVRVLLWTIWSSYKFPLLVHY